jgi:hypothetical protein
VRPSGSVRTAGTDDEQRLNVTAVRERRFGQGSNGVLPTHRVAATISWCGFRPERTELPLDREEVILIISLLADIREQIDRLREALEDEDGDEEEDA